MIFLPRVIKHESGFSSSHDLVFPISLLNALIDTPENPLNTGRVHWVVHNPVQIVEECNGLRVGPRQPLLLHVRKVIADADWRGRTGLLIELLAVPLELVWHQGS